MIPVISTVTIIVTMTITRIKIAIIMNRTIFLKINIKEIILIAKLNMKLRNLKIILIRIMIVIIIVLITVVIMIITIIVITITIIILIIIIIIIMTIIVIHLTIKITQGTSVTQGIQCSYLGVLLKLDRSVKPK